MLHITIDLLPRAGLDVIAVKECFAMDCEKYGDIKKVTVMQDRTWAEQMEMGFPKAELDRIVSEAEKKRA